MPFRSRGSDTYMCWVRVTKLAGHEGYQLRDARHSFAVRKLEEGWDTVAVGRALGHTDGTTINVKVHGKGGEMVAGVYGNREMTPAELVRLKRKGAK